MNDGPRVSKAIMRNLVARMTRVVNSPFLGLDLLHDLAQVVGRRCLHRRILLKRLQVFQRNQLADREHVPVVLVRGHRGGNRTAHIHCALDIGADRLLERITLDVLNLSPGVIDQWIEPALRAGACHRIIHLPVLVPHCRERRAGIVDEVLPRRFVSLAREVVDLVNAIEVGLDEARVLAGHDLLLQTVPLRASGDLSQRRHPVERCEHLLVDRARLDFTRPADNAGSAVTAFPSLTFLALERSDATVRERNRFGAVVGGEDDDRVVHLAHFFELLENVADVVVHLLHAGFVDAPVFVGPRSQHGFILGREYRRDVHPRRVVPAKERLVGLVGIVAVEPVDDFGRDFFVDCLGSFQRQWTGASDFLIRLRAVDGSCMRESVAAGSC